MDKLKPIRFGELKAMARSPAHYLHAVNVGREDTKQMRLGRLLDAALFDRPVYVGPSDRRGKKWTEYVASVPPGVDTFTSDEREEMMPMLESLKLDELAMALLKTGEHQVTRLWEFMGRACRGTPDTYDKGTATLVDLKSTRNADPFWFQRDARRMAYHAQLAWYRHGLRTLGLPVESVYLVTVESAPPYPVVVHRLTENALLAGDKCVRLWMERLASCEAADFWPGYAQTAVPFDVEDEIELTGFADDDSEEDAA